MEDQPLYAPATQQSKNLFIGAGVAICLIGAIVFLCVPRSMADPDIWWHLRDAQLQLSGHVFLAQDVFSFTAAGSSWMNHEWLAELPFYAGFKLCGISGIYFATLITIETIFISLFYLIYRQCKSIPAAAISTIIGICLSTVSFGPRTLLFGWILLLAELLLLTRSMRQPKVIWLLPPLFAVWVNTHGSWLIGIVVFTLFIAACVFSISSGYIENIALPTRQIKRLILCWGASIGALFINPYGRRLVFYPFDLAFRQKLNIANVEEWKSLDFHSPRGRIMFLTLLLLCVLQLLCSRKWSLFELGLTAMGIYSGFTYSRFLFLAAILIGPSLAKSFSALPNKIGRPLSPRVAAAAIFAILCCVIGTARKQNSLATQTDPRFPNKALPYLATFHPHGHVFNDFLWGGFLIWNVRQIPTFIDSRVDIFEYNGTFKDYLDIVRLKDSLTLLDSHKIQYVLYERDTPLIYLLKTTHAWRVDYEDDTTTLLERIASLPAPTP